MVCTLNLSNGLAEGVPEFTFNRQILAKSVYTTGFGCAFTGGTCVTGLGAGAAGLVVLSALAICWSFRMLVVLC